MLVVLSEFDCRKFLNANGVYPSEFFMDLVELKKHISVYTDADLIILLGGMCLFHKRKISEYVTSLKHQISDGSIGISSITVITDTVLPKVSEYYKYESTPIHCELYNNWDKVKKSGVINPFERFKGEAVPCNFHRNIERKQTKLSDSEIKDDELAKLIQIPVFFTR